MPEKYARARNRTPRGDGSRGEAPDESPPLEPICARISPKSPKSKTTHSLVSQLDRGFRIFDKRGPNERYKEE